MGPGTSLAHSPTLDQCPPPVSSPTPGFAGLTGRNLSRNEINSQRLKDVVTLHAITLCEPLYSIRCYLSLSFLFVYFHFFLSTPPSP